MKIFISFIVALIALIQSESLQAVELAPGMDCIENKNCFSNCCFFGQCMPNDFFCQTQVSEEAKPQIEDLKKVSSAQTGAQSDCDANWKCQSNCCFLGSCRDSNFMCKSDKNYGQSCFFNDDCNSGCCSNRLCSYYWDCHREKLEISEAEIQSYKEDEIDLMNESARGCDANWQCQSNCCFLGSCKKSNFMCQNDKNLGEKCAFNDDCNSGCCKSGSCSSYFACHYKISAQQTAEVAEIKELQSKQKELESQNQLCAMNWQCSSGCCYQGICSKQTIMCRSQGELGDICKDDQNCNSGCCAFGFCNPFHFCKFTPTLDGQIESPSPQIVEKYQTSQFQKHIKQQVASAKKEIGLQGTQLQGPCQYNFQCSSSCCDDGKCTQLFQIYCGYQHATGEQCMKNQDCLSSCCFDDGITIEKKCSPIEFCTYEKKHQFRHDCRWNAECQSGCCEFDKCQKDMYWCGGQVEEGQECLFGRDCRSSCCFDGKCSYAMDCYTDDDFLRQSNPELMVFYDFLQKFGSQQKSQANQLDLIQNNSINLLQTTHQNMTMINPDNQRPWYLYVGIVFGLILLIYIIVWTVKNRRKILNICNKKSSMEYSRLIEEEVVGRDRL